MSMPSRRLGERLSCIVLLAVLVTAVPAISSGDVIHLRNGGKVEGRIEKEEPEFLTVRVRYGVVKIERGDVARVEREAGALRKEGRPVSLGVTIEAILEEMDRDVRGTSFELRGTEYFFGFNDEIEYVIAGPRAGITSVSLRAVVRSDAQVRSRGETMARRICESVGLSSKNVDDRLRRLRRGESVAILVEGGTRCHLELCEEADREKTLKVKLVRTASRGSLESPAFADLLRWSGIQKVQMQSVAVVRDLDIARSEALKNLEHIFKMQPANSLEEGTRRYSAHADDLASQLEICESDAGLRYVSLSMAVGEAHLARNTHILIQVLGNTVPGLDVNEIECMFLKLSQASDGEAVTTVWRDRRVRAVSARAMEWVVVTVEHVSRREVDKGSSLSGLGISYRRVLRGDLNRSFRPIASKSPSGYDIWSDSRPEGKLLLLGSKENLSYIELWFELYDLRLVAEKIAEYFDPPLVVGTVSDLGGINARNVHVRQPPPYAFRDRRDDPNPSSSRSLNANVWLMVEFGKSELRAFLQERAKVFKKRSVVIHDDSLHWVVVKMATVLLDGEIEMVNRECRLVIDIPHGSSALRFRLWPRGTERDVFAELVSTKFEAKDADDDGIKNRADLIIARTFLDEFLR